MNVNSGNKQEEDGYNFINYFIRIILDQILFKLNVFDKNLFS